MSDEMKKRVYYFCPFCGKNGCTVSVGFNQLGSIEYCKYCDKEFMVNIKKTDIIIERKTYIVPDIEYCYEPLPKRKIKKLFRNLKELHKIWDNNVD